VFKSEMGQHDVVKNNPHESSEKDDTY